MTVDPRFESRARRENERRTAQAPLLAAVGLVPLTTPTQMAERKARIHDEAVRKTEAMADQIDQAIATRLDALGSFRDEVLARLTAIYPRGLWPDILGASLRRLAQGLEPLEPTQQPMTPAQVRSGQDRVLALKARWAKIDAEYPDVVEKALKQDKDAVRELARLRSCGEDGPEVPVRVTIEGRVHDLIAARPVTVPGEVCPKCLHALWVGIGLGHAPIYQAHCTECLARVGTLEILA